VKTDQSGVTKRQHLEQVKKATGKTPQGLDIPKLPVSLIYLWQTFVSISAGRQTGYSGPLPLSYTEIKSWIELTGCELTPFEVNSIKRLDNVYLRIMNG
jgi:hypothetical protein